MKLYVISGVTGMTGNELARKLTAGGSRVIGFDNFFASSIKTVEDVMGNENFTFYEYDLNNKEQMSALKQEVLSIKDKYERVIYINCAAVVHTEHFYHVNRTFETNVIGMKAFLDQATEVGAQVYINCSTSEVYSMNSWSEGGVSESDYLTLANAEHSQRTSYAAGKLLTEFFMKDAVMEGKIKGCTFLHNEDSCSAVIALAETDEALDGSVYNVATDEEISIIDLVKLCADKLGIDNPEIIFNGFRASDPQRRVLSTEKIRSRTGWEPKITLDQGIEMCVEGMKEN